MNNFIYLTASEMYNKLTSLLSMNIKFSDDIRSNYFCILAKSRILAIKVYRTWYVNLDNWSVENKDALEQLNIRAITPGSFSIKELKRLMGEDNLSYKHLWPMLSNEVNRVIKSGYNSGLLYSRNGFYNQKVYHYDKNSAYAEAFKEAYVPVGVPVKIDGYVEPDDEHLNIYLMELNLEYNSNKIFPYLVNSSDINRMPSQIISNTGFDSIYKVITEVEFKDLEKDYIVYKNVLYTLRFKKRKGLFDNFIDHYYGLRSKSVGDVRTIYKIILAGLAGKLAQEIEETQTPIGMNEYGGIEYKVVKKEAQDVDYLNPAVSLFIIDYVRKVMRDTIREVGYENIILVDTDGFISLKPLDLEINSKLGGWKVNEYNNIIVNGTRSYFYTEGEEFHSSISGLGDIFGDNLNYYNYNSINNLTKLKSTIPVTKKVMYNGEPRYITMNIRIGGR